MLSWLKSREKQGGWFAASLEDELLHFAHGRFAPPGDARISAFGEKVLGTGRARLPKVASELKLQAYRCSTLLRPGEYQLLLVEAPNVPPAELKSAMRWRVKDMIDYHIEDATLDVLDIPPPESAPSRAHMMYAVCAHNDVIQSCVKTYQEARVPLSVIDIRETAQRNIAALFEEESRGLALAYFGEDWGLLTINFKSELYLARRFELGTKQLQASDEAVRKDAFERIGLELQRTFDHFDRQFPYVPVGRLLIGPFPAPSALTSHLTQNLTVPVMDIDLAGKITFAGGAPDATAQWRYFHHFGAALRYEGKAL